MNTEISIIVPVYNLERYLPKCIDSILSQTFTDFELILVNDGSTDKSGNICDKYARQDIRVKVIHKENGGVASSRNAGLDIARGEYVGFVDNDDYVNEHMFEILYNHANMFASDIVICDYIEVNQEGDSLSEYVKYFQTQHFNNIEALHQLYTPNNITFVVPWNKLYKKCLFNNIKYKHGSINDDETVAHKLFYDNKKTTYVHLPLYYYIQRKDSQMSSSFNIQKLSAVYALKEREIFFRKKGEFSLHQKALKHYMEKFFWYYFLAESELKDIEKELKNLKHTFDKSLFYLLKHRDIGWKQKAMCVVFSVNPSLFQWLKKMNMKKKQQRQASE